MASIRIPFPEKDEPGTVVLTGARITIGRLPFNTIQIIDRTISGFHAELIMEGGHYRLHDRGSTNGTFVNGEPAADYHLREACRISFGSVECEFDPAADAAVQGESVPTHGEMNAVRRENAELRGQLAVAREEAAALLGAKAVERSGEAVAREEFTKVVAECEALKTAHLRDGQEIARLKEEAAVLRRDRENLQKAWNATKAELAQFQPRVEAVAVVTAAAPAPAVPAAPVARPAPAPASRPPAPLNRPTMPAARPAQRISPPTGSPFPAPKPGAPTVKLIPVPNTAPDARPVNSSGVRPLPKPAASLHPRASVLPVQAPAPGPKGTQKIG